MLSLFKANKPKNNTGKTDLLPGQYLNQGLTWEDQIAICREHDLKDLALDFYRNRIAESNKLGTAPAKWGEMKMSDLEKEQAGHRVVKITDVPEVWNHQARMYGDAQGMSVVLDTIELGLHLEKGVQPCKATMERAKRVVPDLKVTAEELVLRRRLRDALKAATVVDGEQVNVDRRSSEPPSNRVVAHSSERQNRSE